MERVLFRTSFFYLSLKHDVVGYAIGSVEGRIGVEYFDPGPDVQGQKYAFKCHRQTIEDVDHVWPVNSLAFHPVYVVVDLTL